MLKGQKYGNSGDIRAKQLFSNEINYKLIDESQNLLNLTYPSFLSIPEPCRTSGTHFLTLTIFGVNPNTFLMLIFSALIPRPNFLTYV